MRGISAEGAGHLGPLPRVCQTSATDAMHLLLFRSGVGDRLCEGGKVTAKKDRQVVLRLPSALVAELEKHKRELQKARPFERVSLAAAVRDLLAVALKKKR